MSKAEWDRTPWYEQRILTEGLYAEQPWIQRAAMVERVENPLNLASGLFGELLLDDPDGEDDLTDIGINVRRATTSTPVYQPAGAD